MKVIRLSEEERLQRIAPQREILTQAEVLEIIEPVDPDSLHHQGNGIYEGRWQDELLGAEEIAQLASMNLARVIVTSEQAYRPEGLPTWIAVQFCVIPLPLIETEVVQ